MTHNTQQVCQTIQLPFPASPTHQSMLHVLRNNDSLRPRSATSDSMMQIIQSCQNAPDLWWSSNGGQLRVINTLGCECEKKHSRCIRAKPSTYQFTAERVLTFSRQHCCDTSGLLTVRPRGAVTGTVQLVLPTGQNAGVGRWEIKREMSKFISADASTQGFLLAV